MKKMEKSKVLLNVLCLEDELKDTELLNEMLVDAGYLVNMDIAAGEKEYLSFLKGRNYDIILADYTLPGFDVHTALKLALELQPEVPFICASGTVSEDKAVELLKLGATDYVFKDRLGRLGFSVRRALEGVANQKEWKKAEEKLKKSYALLQIAGEKAKLGGWNVNLEENRSIWSDEVAAIHEMPTGYSPLVEDGINFYAPEWRERITKVFTDCAQEGIPYDEEMEIITANGKRVWIRTIGEPIKNDSGKIIKVQGAFQDITERKKAADAVHQSKKELDSLFKASPELISFIGFDGYFKRLNPAWVKTLGYPMDKLLSLPFIEFVHPDDHEATNAEVAKLAGGQRTIRFDNRYRCNDGSYRWLSWSVIPDLKEKLLYAVARDITERKRTEDAMRKSELKFRNYIDYAPHGVFVFDEMGNYVEVNTAASTITGYSKDELLSMKLSELIPEESMEIAARHFEKVVRDGFGTGEFPFIKKDRSIGYWSVDAVKLSDQRFLGFVVDITKRKQSEEALRESKAKYQEIFESTGTATFIGDENGIILMANKECYSTTGYTATEIIGQKWDQYFAPESLQEIMKNHHLRRQNPDLAPKKHEVKLFNKQGEKRDVILNISMIFGTKQSIVSILDITERKRAEEALLQSELNFHRSISESPIGIRIVSVDGDTVYANKAFLDMYEFNSLEEFKNTPAINRYLSESYAQHQKRKEKRKNGHDIFDYEISIIRKNAEIRHIKVSRKEVLWNGMKHFQVINLNITEQRNAEEELRKLSRAVEQSPNAECITDTEGIIEYVNPITIELTGYTQEELLGQKSSIFSSGEKPKEEYAELWQTIKSGNVWKGELHNKKKNGELYWEYATISPIFDDLGSITHYLGIKEDITAKKQLLDELIAAKEKAEESERLKSAFLANMSHEIRTPMNGILGFAGLLKEPNLSGDEMQEYIEIIEKSGVRMLNIIDQIVDISKIEAGLMEVHIGDTNINEQIEYIYKFFKAEVESKGMKLTYSVSFPEKELIISTDKEKIYAILINLVKNAIKYSFDGSIEFGYSNLVINNRTFLQFFVKDTGIGIPKERQEAVFERFIQADIGDKRAYQGAGLGLSISKAYVKMLGGKIWVESTEGHGSVFYFTIPYQVELVEDIVAKNTIFADEMLPQIKRIKILVVEDIEEASLLIKILINKFCKEVLCARDGFEAVEICRNNPDIDLVLMDIKMPVMNGYEATREIRQFNPSVVIIAQTAFALSGDREKAIEAGCNDYITKPIKRDELMELIQKYFKK